MVKNPDLRLLGPMSFLLLTLGMTSSLQANLRKSQISGNQNTEQGSSGATTQQAFLRVLVASRLPGGLVWIMKCRGEEPIFRQERIALQLRDALDSVVKKDSRYKWQIDKG